MHVANVVGQNQSIVVGDQTHFNTSKKLLCLIVTLYHYSNLMLGKFLRYTKKGTGKWEGYYKHSSGGKLHPWNYGPIFPCSWISATCVLATVPSLHIAHDTVATEILS